MLDLGPAKSSPCHVLLMFAILTTFGCSDISHFTPPTPPENLNAEFTEDIFGTDGVRLTWVDTNGFSDIGFTVYRNGRVLAYLDPSCLDVSGEWGCTSASTSYFDTDVSRGETHCYAVSSHYYDGLEDLIFGESDRCPEVCISIPLQGFTGSGTGE